MTNRKLEFEQLPDRYSVCRLPPKSETPAWIDGEGFVSITRTDAELSIIVAESRVPSDVRAEHGWSGFRIAGSLDFSEIGVLSCVTSVLAEAEVPVLAFSTFDTDYFFVPSSLESAASRALTAAGLSVEEQ